MPYEGPTELWAALPNRQRRIRYGLRLFPGGTGESHGGIRFHVRRLAWEAGRPISTTCGVVVCKNPHLNFAAIIDMADRRMYEDKKQYYLNTGKKQR